MVTRAGLVQSAGYPDNPLRHGNSTGLISSRSRIKWEIWLILGVSLGRSAVYSIIQLVGRLTDDLPLSDQFAELNPSRSPRPYLDLALQLYNIIFPLVPVVLALYFLLLRPNARPLRETLGLDWRDRSFGWSKRIARDWLWGFAFFIGVGVPGLLFYYFGRYLGITVAVHASALPTHWWTIPVLILSAFQNGALEEVIVVGYLYCRTQDLGWSQNGLDWKFLLFSALLRGSYHLYQGVGPFFANFAMGLLFAWWFQSRFGNRRIMPLVIAHTLIDIVVFVGYQGL